MTDNMDMVPSAEEVLAKQKQMQAMEDALMAEGKAIMDTKPLWKSKIFWANAIAIGVMVANQIFGVALTVEQVMIALGGILPIVSVFFRYQAKDISGIVR
jgi:hypothetical protein